MPPRPNPFGRPPIRTPAPPSRPRPQIPPFKHPSQVPDGVQSDLPHESVDQSDKVDNYAESASEIQHAPSLQEKIIETESKPEQPPSPKFTETAIPVEEKKSMENLPEQVESQQTEQNPVSTQDAQEAAREINDENQKEQAYTTQSIVSGPPKPRGIAQRQVARPQMRAPPLQMPKSEQTIPSAKEGPSTGSQQRTTNSRRPQIKAAPVRASPFGGPVEEVVSAGQSQPVEEEKHEEKVVNQVEEIKNEVQKQPHQNPFIATQPVETRIDELGKQEEKVEVGEMGGNIEQEGVKEMENETVMQFESEQNPIETAVKENESESATQLSEVPAFQTNLNESMSESQTDVSLKKKKKKVKKKKLYTQRDNIQEDDLDSLQRQNFAKLTKENLEQQFNQQNKNTENDGDNDSTVNADQTQERNRVAQSNTKKVGENIIVNTATIKSKSITHSVGPEGDKVKRLQDAIQTQKDTNTQVAQKLLGIQSDHQILLKKYSLMQEENELLREEVKELKKETQQINETKQQVMQQQQTRDKQWQKQLKEREDLVNQLTQEIDTLKQERDLYKDRFQRALRDSQTQREHLERQISTNSESLIHSIRNLVAGQRFPERLDQNRSEGLNSASNQQEINLQREIAEQRSKYERQLQQQREELAMRTRDLQRVERKNLKYRENNKILKDAVHFLENRKITPAAGSGSNQNEALFSYQNAVAETNLDFIEQMEFDVPDHDGGEEVSRQLNTSRLSGQIHSSNDRNGTQSAQEAITQRAIFDSHPGEHGLSRRQFQPASYFDKAQDEATGGEGHSNGLNEEAKQMEREPNPYNDYLLNCQIDQQSALGQEGISINNQSMPEDRMINQNNNQSEVFNRPRENSQSRSQNHQRENARSPQNNLFHHDNPSTSNSQNKMSRGTQGNRIAQSQNWMERYNQANNGQYEETADEQRHVQDESGGGNYDNLGNSGTEASLPVYQQVNQIQGSSNMNGLLPNVQILEELVDQEEVPEREEQSSPQQFVADNQATDRQSAQVNLVEPNNQSQVRGSAQRTSRSDEDSMSYGAQDHCEDGESHDDDSRETNEYVGEESGDSGARNSTSRREGDRNRSQRVPEAGSGNYNERQGFSGGELAQKSLHDGQRSQPGAIQSQGAVSTVLVILKNMRQTGSSAGGTSSNPRFGSQNNQQYSSETPVIQPDGQEQYGTGSSGASGILQNQRQTRTVPQHEEQKQQPWVQEQVMEISGHRGRNQNAEVGSRRGNRQINQQPSSGANGGESENSQSNNNRQGRQGGGGGGGDSQVRGVGAAPNSIPRGNSQNEEPGSISQGEGQGRHHRPFTRQKYPRSGHQTSQGQNAPQMGTQQSLAQTLTQPPAPVSLSQEREMKNASQNYSSVQAAVAGSGQVHSRSDQPPFSPATTVGTDQTQAVQQVQNPQVDSVGRWNPFGNQQNSQSCNLNAPASTQSFHRRDNFSQGAAHHSQFPSQSSQMIPSSSTSHNQYGQSAVFGNQNHSRPTQNNIVSFESGSTSFIGSVGYPVRGNQQVGQDPLRNRFGASRVPYTPISQASSPPQNQLSQQIRHQEESSQFQMARGQNQSDHLFSHPHQNAPNTQDYSVGGPGAVGAPPSNQNSAVSHPSQTMMPNRNKISPGSSNDPSQVGRFQGRRPLNQRKLPSVPENSQQQSHFGMGPIKTETDQNQEQMNSLDIQRDEDSQAIINQLPAALRTQNFDSQSQQVAGSEGGSGDHQENQSSQRQFQVNNQRIQIRFNHPPSSQLYENQNTQGSSQLGQDSEMHLYQTQLTPTRRNNDSRKTSGANTPNKEGADTPTTHQQHRGPQTRMPRHPRQPQTTAEFGSAVTAGLNQHLAQYQNEQRLMGGGSNGGNQQNFVHNLTTSHLFQNEMGTSSSIIDQLSAAASRQVPSSSGNNIFDPVQLFDGDLGVEMHGEGGMNHNQHLSSLFGDGSRQEMEHNEGC